MRQRSKGSRLHELFEVAHVGFDLMPSIVRQRDRRHLEQALGFPATSVTSRVPCAIGSKRTSELNTSMPALQLST